MLALVCVLSTYLLCVCVFIIVCPCDRSLATLTLHTQHTSHILCMYVCTQYTIGTMVPTYKPIASHTCTTAIYLTSVR